MSYIKNLLIGADQFVNTIAGGNPDCTISASAYFHGLHSKYWKGIEWIINKTFKPIDGPDHCLQSFHADSAEKYVDGGIIRKSLIALAVVSFCIVACVPIKITGVFK